MADNYGMEVEKLKGIMGDEEQENIRKDTAMQKAVDLIIKEAKEKAPEKKK